MTIRTFQVAISEPSELLTKIGACTITPGLVLMFGSSELLRAPSLFKDLRQTFPDALFCGCTTAGEVLGTSVSDDSLNLTFVQFDHTTVKGSVVHLTSPSESLECGRTLASSLSNEGLRHVLIFSDGLHVNGSALVEGLRQTLPSEVSFTGGLAGDGTNFLETGIFFGETFCSDHACAIGFYGEVLKVAFGSLGGWASFGPDRVITRSHENVLYELDNQPALSLYKDYLGTHSSDLPSSGLLFPLTVKVPGNSEPLVRTLLAVSETDQSLTFAGNVPEGCTAKLMRSNAERLLEGAAGAGYLASIGLNGTPAQLALIISCVGRRLVLKQRCEEELESVQEELGQTVPLTGFYSYGEIAPFIKNAPCELHNQTMTVTAFSEG